MTKPTPTLPPGFRFHPTDEELILYYLRNRVASSPCPASIIADVDIYKIDPWDLPDKAMFGDKEWYFFSPRDRKYPNGVRPNRAAPSGYWKATGTDKPITSSVGNENVGVKKALVFYRGKPPRGIKTNWIMHEYRLSESTKNLKSHRIMPTTLRDSSMRLDDCVLCRIHQKSSHLQEAESPVSNIQNAEQDNNFKMHKSFSLSELLNEADFSLLSRLLDAPIEGEMPVASNQNHSFMNMHPFSETESSVSVAAETESSVSVAAENGSKRQRTSEEGNCFSPEAKRSNNNSWVNYANYVNQLDSQIFLNW